MSSAVFEEGFGVGYEAETDSGYTSEASNFGGPMPEVFFSKQHLKFLNSQLSRLSPQGKQTPHARRKFRVGIKTKSH